MIASPAVQCGWPPCRPVSVCVQPGFGQMCKPPAEGAHVPGVRSDPWRRWVSWLTAYEGDGTHTDYHVLRCKFDVRAAVPRFELINCS